jgi:hypothetical protein
MSTKTRSLFLSDGFLSSSWLLIGLATSVRLLGLEFQLASLEGDQTVSLLKKEGKIFNKK